VALISIRFILAFLARCYRAERHGVSLLVTLHRPSRMRGEGGLGFQRYNTTAGRGSASFVLVWV